MDFHLSVSTFYVEGKSKIELLPPAYQLFYG